MDALSIRSALHVLWQKQSDPGFWVLVVVLLIAVVLLASKLFLTHTAQDRTQQAMDDRRDQD